MTWGKDEWLTDRVARRRWMRSVALVRLAEQILRTSATAGEALECILDEVTDGKGLGRAVDLAKYVRADLVAARRWISSGFDAARAAGVIFASLAVLLPDEFPYALELTLTSVPATPDAEWADHIVWRSPEPLHLRVSTLVLGAIGAATMRDAEYVVPISYAAFVLRDALRSLDAESVGVTTALISYHGGDGLAVPLR